MNISIEKLFRFAHAAAIALVFPVVVLAQTGGVNEAGRQADRYYPSKDMQESRNELKSMLGDRKTGSILLNQNEAQFVDGRENYYVNGQAWYGTDKNRIWLKAEGAASLNDKKVEESELQALWSHAISPYFNVQAGYRRDFKPKGLDHAVLGIQGLAPYWFEIDVSSYLSVDGDVTARAEVEYDYRLTQRLILQPRIEANFSAQDIQDWNLGSGLTSANAGLRLRYELRREIAPYIGVEWQGTFGDTRDISKAVGNGGSQTVLMAGVRLWY